MLCTIVENSHLQIFYPFPSWKYFSFSQLQCHIWSIKNCFTDLLYNSASAYSTIDIKVPVSLINSKTSFEETLHSCSDLIKLLIWIYYSYHTLLHNIGKVPSSLYPNLDFITIIRNICYQPPTREHLKEQKERNTW